MFCSRCGKEVESKSNYCEFCGAPIDVERNCVEKKHLKKEKNFWRKEKKYSLILKIMLSAGFLSFFAPFVKITVDGMTEISTGIELIQSVIHGGFFDEIGNPFPEIILIIILASCGIALCFTFLPNMTMEAGYTAGFAMACLVLFRITYIRYCNMYNYRYREYGIIFMPKFLWGWNLVMFFFGMSVLYSILLETGILQKYLANNISFEEVSMEAKSIRRYGIVFLVLITIVGGVLAFRGNTIVGKWYAVGSDVLEMELSFTSDGRFSNGSTGGNYSAEGNTLILEWNPLYGTRSYEYEIKGSKLYIYNGNHTYIYSRNETERPKGRVIDIQ